MFIKSFTSEESDSNILAAKLWNQLEPYVVIDRETLISDPELTNREYWDKKLPFKLRNYNEFLNHETFLLNLMELIDSRKVQISISKRFKASVEEVVSDISQELKRIEVD